MSATTIIAEHPPSEDIALELFKAEEVASGAHNSPVRSTQSDAAIDVHSVQNDSSLADPTPSADEEARSQLAISLPPIDGGRRAW